MLRSATFSLLAGVLGLGLPCADVTQLSLGHGQGNSGVRLAIQGSTFSAVCPTGWRRLNPGDSAFSIVNFSPERRVRGLIIPGDGALIAVIPMAKNHKTLDDWIQSDMRFASEVTRRSIVLQSTAGKGVLSIIEVDSVIDDGDRIKRVGLYFKIDDSIFRAELTCWEKDKKLLEYTETLRIVVESMDRRHRQM